MFQHRAGWPLDVGGPSCWRGFAGKLAVKTAPTKAVARRWYIAGWDGRWMLVPLLLARLRWKLAIKTAPTKAVTRGWTIAGRDGR
ncbi:hypothetical protein CXK97_08600 [Stutzerimonas stutzeri]|nr:hypothetical protein CXK97_08600 [Stutzerimonas stutzeri]